MGHPYMILLVLLCQTMVYKEVTALFALRDREDRSVAWRAIQCADNPTTHRWRFRGRQGRRLDQDPELVRCGIDRSSVAEKLTPVGFRYFFVVTNYFLYGESIIYYFKVNLFPAGA